MTDVTITDNPDQTRYEAHIDGELAGFAVYQLTDDLIVFTHTEVFPQFEGKGVASALAKESLADVRAKGGRKVMPLCPFYKAYVSKHREDYADLIYGS